MNFNDTSNETPVRFYFIHIYETRIGTFGPIYKKYYTGDVDRMERDSEWPYLQCVPVEQGFTDLAEAERVAAMTTYTLEDFRADRRGEFGHAPVGTLKERKAGVVEVWRVHSQVCPDPRSAALAFSAILSADKGIRNEVSEFSEGFRVVTDDAKFLEFRRS